MNPRDTNEIQKLKTFLAGPFATIIEKDCLKYILELESVNRELKADIREISKNLKGRN